MESSTPAKRTAGSDPTTWLDQCGDVLFQYALLRVGCSTLAEDLVQETLLAALKGRDRFAGESSEKTWLVAILRRKIADHLRQASRQPTADLLERLEAQTFDRRSHWVDGPARWPGNPTDALEKREFWSVFEKCLSELPPAHAEAFCLREFGEFETSDACKVLDVSPSNLSVQLHRARMALRKCLEHNWFVPSR